MIEFERKLINTYVEFDQRIDPNNFLNKLHKRINETEQKEKTTKVSFAMTFLVFILSATQFGIPDSGFDKVITYSTENLLETDLWNIKIDSLGYSQDFFNNMAYFLFDEGYVWETVELLEQFELNKEES